MGCGPRHPITPDLTLVDEIASFLATQTYLFQDQGYVDFLECYAGASIARPDGTWLVDMPGFTESISTHLIRGEGRIVDENGYYWFCSSIVVDSAEHRDRGLSFAFDATGTRTWGIYRSMDAEYRDFQQGNVPVDWYCDTFLEWLDAFIDREGYLFR